MTRIPVELAERSYDILIEPGALASAGNHVGEHAKNGRVFVITDKNVASHWLPALRSALDKIDIKCIEKILPAGEATKSWQMLEDLVEGLLAQQIERSDILIALGGGVIGDLVGFAAAIIKRGCKFVQIPTTLLAQVDSSVGGKTAINSKAGKNLVGSFNQPEFVLIDPEVLDSLPDRELRAGYAEVLKYGLIDKPDFFDWCEQNGPDVLGRDTDALVHAIAESVAAKARIVAEDERELSGKRALLNLGHTFGHALEAETGYSERLVHGEAVAAGMALAFGYSRRRGHCPEADTRRVTAALQSSNLPFDLASASVQATGTALVAHMMHDKKMQSGRLPFLLANGIGQTFVAPDVDLEDVAEFLDNSR
ncbi:MAG: 3-dehydroquinate synthase [Pseudomonadota bacterium]